MRRREFIAGSIAVAAEKSVLPSSAWAQSAPRINRIIDAHCHVFNAADLPLEGSLVCADFSMRETGIPCRAAASRLIEQARMARPTRKYLFGKRTVSLHEFFVCDLLVVHLVHRDTVSTVIK